MKKKYQVRLTEKEHRKFTRLASTGRGSAKTLTHARILLKADLNHINGGWTDIQISQALDISISTVVRVRRQYVEKGVRWALYGKPCRRGKRKSNQNCKFYLQMLAQKSPPPGHDQWTYRLLAQKAVELGYFESISHETVRKILNKASLPFLVFLW